MNPVKPKHIQNYAEACLSTLSAQGLGGMLVLGGAFGLSYYIEYRRTHDLDAWWIPSTGAEERHRIVTSIQETLGHFGEIRTRSWGDVVSVDLIIENKVVFSFQIASRSAQIVEPQVAPWPPGTLLDSFEDLVAAKMVALVERGAPRDFRDIDAVCRASLANPAACWNLWRRRCELSGSDTAASRARLAVLTHLERIELHRPLKAIPDAADRASAERLRAWFRGEFLDGLLD